MVGAPAEERFVLLTGLRGDDLAAEAVGQLSGEPLIHKKVANLMKTGLTEHQALDKLLRSRYDELKERFGMAPDVLKAIRAGDVGYCAVGAVEADFLSRAELCGSSNGDHCKWVGVAGHSTAEKTPLSDAPIDEVVDVLDHRAKQATRDGK